MLMRISTILFAVPGIILLILYGIELSAITQCQESGLFYDTTLKQCIEQQPPFSSFYMRHTLFVNAMLIISTISALIMTISMSKNHRR